MKPGDKIIKFQKNQFTPKYKHLGDCSFCDKRGFHDQRLELTVCPDCSDIISFELDPDYSYEDQKSSIINWGTTTDEEHYYGTKENPPTECFVCTRSLNDFTAHTLTKPVPQGVKGGILGVVGVCIHCQEDLFHNMDIDPMNYYLDYCDSCNSKYPITEHEYIHRQKTLWESDEKILCNKCLHDKLQIKYKTPLYVKGTCLKCGKIKDLRMANFLTALSYTQDNSNILGVCDSCIQEVTFDYSYYTKFISIFYGGLENLICHIIPVKDFKNYDTYFITGVTEYANLIKNKYYEY